MAENLYTLIKGKNLLAYRDEEIRAAVARTVAIEGNRGWKLSKEKQSHRVDVVIALAMACLACVRAQSDAYDYSMAWVTGQPYNAPVIISDDPATKLEAAKRREVEGRDFGSRR